MLDRQGKGSGATSPLPCVQQTRYGSRCIQFTPKTEDGPSKSDNPVDYLQQPQKQPIPTVQHGLTPQNRVC
jgi:hypothetical protein